MKKIIAVLLCLTVLLGCFPALSAGAAEDTPKKGDKFMVTSDNGLRLRKSPSIENGAIIRVLPYGTVVTLAGDYGDWANVKAGNDTGWVSTQYIKKVETISDSDKLSHAGILARLDELRVKFPDGKYWNHYGSSQKNMDGWTNTPCPSNGGHTSTKWCNGQCDGWARKIGLDLFGASTYDTKKWEKKYTLEGLCIGDVIRFGGWHTVVVTGFTSDKNTIIISDCNWKCNCNIDWDRSFSLSRYAPRGYFVLHYKGNTLTREALQNVGKPTTTKPTTTTTAKPTTTTTAVQMSGSVPSDSDVVRLSGKDRYGTAAAISAKGWEKAENVVLASATGYADALAGVPFAYALDAPILLVSGSALNSAAADEIKRLGAKNAYILGGTASVSEEIAASLTADGITVNRIAGQDRFETAEKIAAEMKAMDAIKSKTVLIASAENYPDALAASSPAAMNGSPILYSPAGGELKESTLKCIADLEFTDAVILGGKAAVGEDAETVLEKAGLKADRCGGANRYETAVKISERFIGGFSGKTVCFATGSKFPDALAGGVFAAKSSAPVILVDNGAKLESVRKFAGGIRPETIYIFGGESMVPEGLVGYCFDADAK